LIFLAITLIAIFFFSIEHYLKSPRKTPYYREKIEAAQHASHAMELLREEVIKRNIPSDSINDPNGTYLVGRKFTFITSSYNPLTDVQLSLNPNFSAAIIEMFKELRLKEGDIIAINTSGSYPGLNVAVLSACDVLRLNPIITTDASSGSFGANNPLFSWLDMDDLLHKKNIFKNKTYAASMGGEKDNGEGLSPEGRNLLKAIIQKNNVKFIHSGSLAGNIRERYTLYLNHSKHFNKKIKAYIDIGGTLTGFGQTIPDTLLKPGINRFPEKQILSNYGLMQMMVEERIPVLYIGEIQKLAQAMGLSETTVPQSLPGKDPLFFEERYSVKLATLFLILLIGLLVLYIRLEIFLKKESR
jgi:poly-gamma-glutamate system protein